jgi:rhamnose utilization protein RhaD (predicted bifunctional aldolase and dehydrogenase)
MPEYTRIESRTGLQQLRELTERVGSDPLLTQASTGNTSIKSDGVLWIKATGKWMTDALRDDIFIPLDLAVLSKCLERGVNPTECYPNASLETAMHAVLPHPVVLHAHCVNTIAWAVRRDAPSQLQGRLQGLSWQWIPYVPSGLPLARAIDRARSARPDADVFVLGNHGLVIGGASVTAVARLLAEVSHRLCVAPRRAHPADYATLLEISTDSPWTLPDDDEVHALATDPASQAILAGGLLYPCQAIFCDSMTTELFRSIPPPGLRDDWQHRYRDRPFLIVDGHGVLVSRSMPPAELATISGLTQVVQRLSASAPLRYLTEPEVAAMAGQASYHYRELSNQRSR